MMTAAEHVDVVILCGGLGSRLRSVVRDRPKPMALIQGRPFLDFVVDHLLAQGFSRMIFCTGYQGQWIADHVKARRDIDALVSHEDRPLGTGGALRACRRLLSRDTTLVLNGDSLCRTDVSRLLAAHRRRSAVATVAVVPANGRSDGGGVSVDAEGRMLAFLEKEDGPYINAGIYAIQTSSVSRFPVHTPCSLEREVFPPLVGRGLYGLICEGPLYDIGTPERLADFQARSCAASENEIMKGAAC